MPEILDIFRKPAEKGRGEEEEKKADVVKEEERLNEFRILMDSERNRNVLALIFLFGYKLRIDLIRRDWEEIVTEPEENLSKKEENEKIDRIIWNILANGASELTNAENAVWKLEEVLAEDGESQERAWKQYGEDMFYGKLWKDNSTIFRIGADPFFALFQSMKIVGAGEEKWEKFLKFYFLQYQKKTEQKEISTNLIDNVNYCNLTSKKNFFQVIRFVNGLKINGNLNKEKSYRLFWEKYLSAVTILGYTERMESWMFKLSGNLSQNREIREMAESLMKQLLEELKRQQGEQKFDYIKDEYSDIIRFVEKNQELIRCKTEAPKRDPFMKTEMHSRWVHQEEVDRLKKLWEEGRKEQFYAELKESYMNGKLYLQELNAILRGCCEK